MPTLTAANSAITLAITGIFPAPQTLQGFSAEDVFTVEAITPVEVLMGVDAQLSGGWVAVPVRQSISLQADSDSNFVFETWQQEQQTQQEVFTAEGFVTLPGLGLAYTCTRGFLTSYPTIADARRIMQPRRYTITWAKIIPTPI